MMTKQAQTEIELIRQGAFSIYKKANVHPSHWEALLDMQSTKTAQTLQAMEKKEKVAAFLKSLPVIKQAMVKAKSEKTQAEKKHLNADTANMVASRPR